MYEFEINDAVYVMQFHYEDLPNWSEYNDGVHYPLEKTPFDTGLLYKDDPNLRINIFKLTVIEKHLSNCTDTECLKETGNINNSYNKHKYILMDDSGNTWQTMPKVSAIALEKVNSDNTFLTKAIGLADWIKTATVIINEVYSYLPEYTGQEFKSEQLRIMAFAHSEKYRDLAKLLTKLLNGICAEFLNKEGLGLYYKSNISGIYEKVNLEDLSKLAYAKSIQMELLLSRFIILPKNN